MVWKSLRYQMEPAVTRSGDGGPNGRLSGPLVQKDVVGVLPDSPFLSPVHQAGFLVQGGALSSLPDKVNVPQSIHGDIREPVPAGKGGGQFHRRAPGSLLGLKIARNPDRNGQQYQGPYGPQSDG